MSDELSHLERAAIDALLAGEHPVLAALRDQFKDCRFKHRKLTGVGFFTHLEVDRAHHARATSRDRLWLHDVDADVSGLLHGAGFQLLVTAGYLELLEGFAYGDEGWPDEVGDFVLFYERVSSNGHVDRASTRDMTTLGLDDRSSFSPPRSL
jgi:hypothetical protein